MVRFRRILWAIILTVSIVSFFLCVTGYAQKREPDVEFVPTPQEVVLEMLKMAGVTKDDLVYDLGCGDGRFVITAAKVFGARGVGVDIDPERIEHSRANVNKAGVTDRVKIIQGDLFRTNLKEATVVTLYLTPELNVRLRPKFFRELKPGTRIVSHDFDMGDWKPDNTGLLHNITYYYPDKTYVRDAPFYYWVIPAKAAGTWRWNTSTSTSKRDYSLRLVQKFQEISGNLSIEGREVPIADARLIGDLLRFTFRDNADKEKAMMRFNGRISGDTVKGNVEVQGGPLAGNYNWIARRSF